MNNVFDSIMDNQKKVYDYWTDFTKKAVSNMNGNTPKSESPMDLMKTYFEEQKSLLEEFSKIDPKEALEKSPENFKKWMTLQTEFAERWAKSYREGAEKFGVKTPQYEMPKEPFTAMENGIKQWADWSKQANDWLKTNILSKMPTEMQGHYKNFSASYADLYKQWESFSKMIQFGATQKEIVDKYFSTDAYKSFIDKFMNFKSIGNVNEVLENANNYFEEYIAALGKLAPNANDMSQNWKKMLEQFASSDLSPLFKTALELNSQLQHNSQPLFNIVEGKEAKAAKILRDIQFAYTAYIVKSSDMQTKVYQAGSTVLPEVLKSYYEGVKEGNKLPNYQEFYTQYINALEKVILVVLESSEYSVLQSDVAKTGVTVKAKYEELVELAFSDMPFVMKSQVDDVALENATLRKKLRDVEARLAALEKGATPAAVKEPTAAKTSEKKKLAPTAN